MNYTGNYHLPQWVKDDRILMEDFNAAMTNIENGLTGNRDTAEELRQCGGEMDTKNLKRLCRIAYNHYWTVASMNPQPRQLGLFSQTPARDTTNLSETTLWNNACFVGKGTGTYDINTIQQYIDQISALKIIKGDLAACVPMEAGICVPASCQLDSFTLNGSYNSNVPNTPAWFRFSLTNQDTGILEQGFEVNLGMESTSAGGSFTVRGPFYLHSGTHYRLKLEPLDAVCNMDASFAISIFDYLYVKTTQNGTLTASRTLEVPGGSLGGMIILRCWSGGPDGRLTVKWDGKELQPTVSQLSRPEAGRAVYEFIYFRNEPVPASTTVSLQFDCGTHGDFLLYDWGAVLL